VSVKSSRLSDPPQIDPQYYSTPEDQALALYSFKKLRRTLAKFAEYNFTTGPNSGEVVPGLEIQSDEDILTHIRDTAIPVWHASGTCAMLPRERDGVVDANLKVYGVNRLRVPSRTT
jgi:choline dehydrogenase